MSQYLNAHKQVVRAKVSLAEEKVAHVNALLGWESEDRAMEEAREEIAKKQQQ